jgi:hypothetical protein
MHSSCVRVKHSLVQQWHAYSCIPPIEKQRAQQHQLDGQPTEKGGSCAYCTSTATVPLPPLFARYSCILGRMDAATSYSTAAQRGCELVTSRRTPSICLQTVTHHAEVPQPCRWRSFTSGDTVPFAAAVVAEKVAVAVELSGVRVSCNT